MMSCGLGLTNCGASMKCHWSSGWSVVGYSDESGAGPWADKGGLCAWVLVIGLTGKGYMECHWLALFPINLFGHFPSAYTPCLPTMSSSSASSSCSAPYTLCHTCHGAVCVCGQCGNHTAQQEEGDPFIFNEGMYRVSHLWWHHYTCWTHGS